MTWTQNGNGYNPTPTPALRHYLIMLAVPLSLLAISGGIGTYVKLERLEISTVSAADQLRNHINTLLRQHTRLETDIKNLEVEIDERTIDRYKRQDSINDLAPILFSIRTLEKQVFDISKYYKYNPPNHEPTYPPGAVHPSR